MSVQEMKPIKEGKVREIYDNGHEGVRSARAVDVGHAGPLLPGGGVIGGEPRIAQGQGFSKCKCRIPVSGLIHDGLAFLVG